MNPKEASSSQAEAARILAEHRRRAREIDQDRYCIWQPDVAFTTSVRTNSAVTLLHRMNVFPATDAPCLEVGHGNLGWLCVLIGWGVHEQCLHGIELDAERAAVARAILPAADLRVGDACEMPWENGLFRLVIASTVFTSILDDGVRRLLAREIVRVLAPGGALLWYDFAYNNPKNPNVRGIKPKEVRQLFPQLHGTMKWVTLAPPIARAVAPRSYLLASMLEAVPFLRTHLLGVLVKPRGPAASPADAGSTTHSVGAADG
jgi:SAM-dependent methyltransferase